MREREEDVVAELGVEFILGNRFEGSVESDEVLVEVARVYSCGEDGLTKGDADGFNLSKGLVPELGGV